ncbi:hypothetical protein [Streptomyces alanosinicus]|uniref:Uncharacterized protein n=1 Tax=Streptomyces alanosinicus TaxID=68171 RepID=A0A919D7L7_9ACTN|nr:hypothetical protein [Streptomyces alanosinicus]GHE13446.1 hypothetical protein GCM10010339_80400 [Streptomyces alanosinicus]
MSRLRQRLLPLTVLLASVAALIASLVWVAGNGSPSWGPRTGMTTGGVASRQGPIRNLADADRAAGRFADRWGLRVGEVMQFSNGYYAQLLDSSGKGATEALIDPRSGAVQLEFGPAMMWNTAYGMMPTGTQPGPTKIGPGQAVRIADRWLHDHHKDLHAAKPDWFPGYFTLHTLRDDHIVGMLSVNATTGDVWYHTWHGRFVREEEPSPSRNSTSG